MTTAYIVCALRTAGGRTGGRLSGWHPADLAAQVIDALVARSGADPSSIDDVILGCVSQVGEQASNVARNAVLASSLPESVPATTIDRQCGSSQQALHFAAQAVMSGTMDLVIAGGVESMTRVPMFSPNALAAKAGLGTSVSPAMQRRYPGVEFSQFAGAEQLARKYGLDRDALDAYALESHRRAAAASESGRFAAELLAVPGRRHEEGAHNGTSDHPGGGDRSDETGRAHAPGTAPARRTATPPRNDGGLHLLDEGIRFDASLDGIAAVRPLSEGGCITAANASQLCDGASGVLVASERGLKTLGVAPLARVYHLSVIGHDPVIMLEAPLPATGQALRKAGLGLGDIGLFEVNEAFASVPLAWLQATGADPARLNVHGGAIALGHPLGASGTRLLTTLVHALQARGERYGLQTMCEGGGMANVTVVERL